MTMNREHMPDEARLRDILFGRKIINVQIGDIPRPEGESYYWDRPQGSLTLDDGTVLLVAGNTGGCSCGSGDYELSILNRVDNAITNVRVEENPDGDDYTCTECGQYYCDHEQTERGTYRIFVVAEDHNEHLLAQFDGSDGNGYYGTGWWITVLQDQS